MIKEEHIYLRQLGLARPTIVEHKNCWGEVERVQTINLSLNDLVKVWRKCFLIDPDEIIFLHMNPIDYEHFMRKAFSATKSVIELFNEEYVVCLNGENYEEKI